MRADPDIWALVARPCVCHAAGTRGVADLGESWRIDAGAALRGFQHGLSMVDLWLIYGFLWLIYG